MKVSAGSALSGGSRNLGVPVWASGGGRQPLAVLALELRDSRRCLHMAFSLCHCVQIFLVLETPSISIGLGSTLIQYDLILT